MTFRKSKNHFITTIKPEQINLFKSCNDDYYRLSRPEQNLFQAIFEKVHNIMKGNKVLIYAKHLSYC